MWYSQTPRLSPERKGVVTERFTRLGITIGAKPTTFTRKKRCCDYRSVRMSNHNRVIPTTFTRKKRCCDLSVIKHTISFWNPTTFTRKKRCCDKQALPGCSSFKVKIATPTTFIRKKRCCDLKIIRLMLFEHE